MKKRIFVVAVLAVLCFSISLTVYSFQTELEVEINGNKMDSFAKIIDGEVYLPAKALSKSESFNVQWSSESNIVNITTVTSDELIPEIIKSVSPSVVGIIGTISEDADFGASKYSEQYAHGTGVIMKETGEILTNAHVVKFMDTIVVVLSDGSGYEAKLKYMDEKTDLAVIKINKTGLKEAKFGKQEDIVTGKTVIAIGTPVSFSLRNSASIGYISGINRSLDSEYRLIQTDAAINPGNSGGPLVNLKGEVIGINSSKYAGVGMEGLGFAIPVDTIKYAINHFDAYGKIKRPYMGTVFEENWAARIGLPSKNGLTITKIEKNSPAQKSGLKEKDILLSINDNNVNNIVDFNEEMKKYLPQESLKLKIKRDGIIRNISIVPGEN